MSNVAIFKSGETPQYLKSVNTPDYEGDPNVLVNPDISALGNVPLKYWKRVADLIEEMTTSEKQAADDAELQARKDAVTVELVARGLIEAGNTRWSQGLTITKAQVIQWLKDNTI